MLHQNAFRLLPLILLTAALGFTPPTFGQGRDTVFAVQKLFREKRGSANGYSSAAASTLAPKQYTQRPDGRPTTLEAQSARQDVLAGSAFAAVGMIKGERYSALREARIIEGYALGNPIPADIRRKLRRKHFHRTVQDITVAP
ncbi:hypothetical protein GCM10022409_02320 [Hymenobacter glaciei]|uniref:Uncharacterized protein n=1 Tax=Hymenobacter glaciei TaxID=877209 RepID=A0ABP7T7F1_9BACT